MGIEDRVGGGKLVLFGLQHLLALTGIWIFPVALGAALHLTRADVGHIVQACFLVTGVVTVLQSSRVVRLPIVQGPSAAFFAALLTSGAAYGLDTAFGSMIVAGGIFMLLTLPVGRLGVFGHIAKYIADPIVFGTLIVIIGAQLAAIGLPGWFGTRGTASFGWGSFWIGVATMCTILLCLVLGGRGLVKRGAMVWGIAVGSVLSAIAGTWSFPDLGQASVVGAPSLLPFGFSVQWPVVVIMLLAFLHAGAEAVGLYTLVSGWDGQKVTNERVNRGLFTEFTGSVAGAALGGIGSVSYPENVGIIRITRVGSRYVTMASGVFALALAFLPQASLIIASLSSAVLAAASTMLFGIIAMAGVQMLGNVEWDDLNISVAATSFVVALGGQWLPEEIVKTLPAQLADIVTTPMMCGVVLLISLNMLVNHCVRPLLERRRPASVGDPVAELVKK